MTSPSNVDMKGNDEQIHDGRSDSAHEAELKKAGSTPKEGSDEQTSQEKDESYEQ